MISSLTSQIVSTVTLASEDLRLRISNVRPVLYEQGMIFEALTFDLDGVNHLGVLKNRNLELMLGHGEKIDSAIALRVFLSGDSNAIS